MDNSVIVAILSLVGTCVGSICGILAANKLSNYRIQQLEAKVEKHNSVIERVFRLEEREKDDRDKIEELEKYHR